MSQQLSVDQTPDGWDRVVLDYEQAVEALTGQFVERALDMAGVGRGYRVLDVAAGPGVMTFAAAGKGADVLGTDFAPKMVDRLRQRVADSVVSNVNVQVMDGQALEAPDASFDTVCSNFGVIFFPDPDQGFREMYRVLKPGCTAVVSAWSWAERFEPLQLMMGAVRHVIPDSTPASPPVWMRFQDPEALRQSIQQAGFAKTEVVTLPGVWSFPSVGWLRKNLLGVAPAIQALFTRFTEEQRGRILDKMGETLTERFGAAPPSLSVEAHIGLGTKE